MLDPACPRGLEVQINPIPNPSPEEQCWVDVCDGKAGVEIDTAVIINCGAVLERWTNGKWKSALHRVQNSREKRLSIVTSALTPRQDVMLECLPGCAGAGNVLPPVRAGDFLNNRVALQRSDYVQPIAAV
jgi:isopenicillin N synthase-like dioxygenase